MPEGAEHPDVTKSTGKWCTKNQQNIHTYIYITLPHKTIHFHVQFYSSTTTNEIILQVQTTTLKFMFASGVTWKETRTWCTSNE